MDYKSLMESLFSLACHADQKGLTVGKEILLNAITEVALIQGQEQKEIAPMDTSEGRHLQLVSCVNKR